MVVGRRRRGPGQAGGGLSGWRCGDVTWHGTDLAKPFQLRRLIRLLALAQLLTRTAPRAVRVEVGPRLLGMPLQEQRRGALERHGGVFRKVIR